MTSKKSTGEILSELVERAQHGDQEAMGAIYDEFATDIYRYALATTKNPDIAEDVASEVFLRAWKHLSTYKGTGNHFKSYLYTIARNYMCDVFRKESRTTPLTEAHTPLLSTNTTLDTAFLTEQQHIIMNALDMLPELQREVILLRFFENLSVKETAKIVGKSNINIRVIQSRALRKLQKILS